MSKTVQRILTVVSIGLTLAFVVIVANQTAQFTEMLARINPTLGQASLWFLVFVYAGCLLVPVVLILRLPKPLIPPEVESGPEFDAHMERLKKRLRANPRLAGRTIDSPEEVEDAITALDSQAGQILESTGSRVFLITSVSQNGALDALVVLALQAKLVWDVAHVYTQRPTIRELSYLYSNVATTAFLAGEIEDADFAEQVEAVMGSVLGSVAGAIPGLQAASTIFVTSVLSGTANALMTLRVGIIAQEYSRARARRPRTAIRRLALVGAAGMVTGIAVSGATRISKSLLKASGKGVTSAAAGMGRSVVKAGSAAADWMAFWRRWDESPDDPELRLDLDPDPDAAPSG
jgi:hypothetical protein